MRYESKHREMKLTAATTCNKINLLTSATLRSLLRLAYMKQFRTLEPNSVICEDFQKINHRDRIIHIFNVPDDEEIFETSYIDSNEIIYKIGMVFVTEMGVDKLSFGKVINIFFHQENVYLLLSPLAVTGFDDHYFAYNVKDTNLRILRQINELHDIHPCLLIKKNSDIFVATRYIL